MKICAVVTSYDVTLMPHVYLPAASAQIAFTQNSMTIPMLEYHYILGEIYQFFLKLPLKPVQAYFYSPVEPGVGLNVDEEKIESEKEITFK
jgi:L-alanine-DL-glutamate epimerase-like enolase superfamily enzyme